MGEVETACSLFQFASWYSRSVNPHTAPSTTGSQSRLGCNVKASFQRIVFSGADLIVNFKSEEGSFRFII